MKRVSIDDLLVDDRERGIFRVNRRAFLDEDVLRLEQSRIFDRVWLYVGHESEIPTPGDFIRREVGGRPVIFVRDDRGTPRVHFNVCSHRGNVVCREAAGNARLFRCAYHSWTYNTQGELIGVPGKEGYSTAFDTSELKLAAPARVDGYRGLYFMSVSPEAGDLADFLAPAREYIDLILDYTDAGLQIAKGTQAYSSRTNWKLLVENSMDNYHFLATHHRYLKQFLPDMGLDGKGWSLSGHIGKGLGGGHALIEGPIGPLPLSAQATEHLAQNRRRLEARHGIERTRRILDYGRNLFIFPNLFLISNWRTIRTFFPRSPGYVEISSWALLPKDDTPELREMRVNNYISFLGPAGFGTPDDVDMLEGCQRGFTAAPDTWSDVSRGMLTEAEGTSEEQMRAFWRRWREVLAADVERSERADILNRAPAACGG